MSQSTQPMEDSASAMEDVKLPATVADADADMDGTQDPAFWNNHYEDIDTAAAPRNLSVYPNTNLFFHSSEYFGSYLAFGQAIARSRFDRLAPVIEGAGGGGGCGDDKKNTGTKKRKGENDEDKHTKLQKTNGGAVKRAVFLKVLSRSHDFLLSGHFCQFARIADEYDNKEILLARRQMERLARAGEVRGRLGKHPGVDCASRFSDWTVFTLLAETNSFPSPTVCVNTGNDLYRQFPDALFAGLNSVSPSGDWADLSNIIFQYAPFGLISNPSPAYCLRALATRGLFITDFEMFIEAYHGLMTDTTCRPSFQSIRNFVCPGCLSSTIDSHLSDCPMVCLCIRPPVIPSCMTAQVRWIDGLWEPYMFADNIVTWLCAFYEDVILGKFTAHKV